MGERHFARVFHKRMDLKFHHKGGSRRANFTLRNGMKVDVVTRRPIKGIYTPELAVPANSRGKVDLWVLIIWYGTWRDPEIAGWVPESIAVSEGRIVQFHEIGVPNLVVDHGLLAPMDWLKPYDHPRGPREFDLEWFNNRAAELSALRIEPEPRVQENVAPAAPTDAQMGLW